MNLNLSFMQHGQYQTVVSHYRTILSLICLLISWGTNWVTNFDLNCPFNDFTISQK